MPGLTLNTDGAAAPRNTPIYPPPNIASQMANASATTSQNPNPNLNARTNTNTTTQQTPARSSSPQRPTYSPITPPLNPVAFPPRPTYTHSSQKTQTAIPPPPPEPIDFDTNPDVLALKSAISILQLQRRKAETDMAVLSRAKAAALADPEAFVRDLRTGRIAVEGEGLMIGGGSGGGDGEREDSSSDSDSDSDGDEDMGEAGTSSAAGQQHPTQTQPQAQPAGPGPSSAVKTDPDAIAVDQPQSQRPPPQQQHSPWAKLPKPQNVVRCPPINWSQYAVVGESLDKLHAEQQARPSQGVPATVAPDGRYEFSGAAGKQEKLVGVAAPYAPGKDRIDRKPKGPKR
ncbi:hypothetical protein F5Y05DRAFT_368532 [Hypoxylon sp. FL0543]|nr:hypothetical protein F5Y05DRAFT_368532 [Hypoxylon sp. FL0543]